jgi:hypothetical protein
MVWVRDLVQIRAEPATLRGVTAMLANAVNDEEGSMTDAPVNCAPARQSAARKSGKNRHLALIRIAPGRSDVSS